jgi:hypothetical protein
MYVSGSRYIQADLLRDTAERIHTGSRPRYVFADIDDITMHVIEAGDTLHSLADLYYGSENSNSATYWWLIADFQPEPIQDPTIALEPGDIILIPPISIVQDVSDAYADGAPAGF